MLAKKLRTCIKCGNSKKLIWFRHGSGGRGYKDTCVTCENKASRKAEYITTTFIPPPKPEPIPFIDWSIYDLHPPDTINCRCGNRFDSHTRYEYYRKRHLIISRKPCPRCMAVSSFESVRAAAWIMIVNTPS
jgi:hypothetical protein